MAETEKKLKIVAVTGCPTGIAHTFMAEKTLKKVALAKGIEIKVETNGAVGVENELSPSDIAEADGVIVACDKHTDRERFKGKPVLEVPVADGIKKADALIQTLIDGKAPIYAGMAGTEKVAGQTVKPAGKESVGRQIYKHLMSGVSTMLPFVVAGGVLIAVSFLWGIFSADPNSNQYNPFAALLMDIGGTAMGLMVPIFGAYIAYSVANKAGLVAGFVGALIAANVGAGFIGGIIAGFAAGYLVLGLVKSLSKLPKEYEGLKSIFLIPIISVFVIGVLMYTVGAPLQAVNNAMMNFLAGLQNSNPILLGLVIGSMVAFDFGGPVNKAAYVTGTLLLGQGNYFFMAGVSAACMTPPLVVALSTTIFRKEYDSEERSAGVVNYVLGFTHITEGAIPFVAKNPLILIPVMMFASSISAILSYLTKVQVPAPHGGFLILPLVTKPLTWVLCIFIGSLVGALLMGFYQKYSHKKEKT